MRRKVAAVLAAAAMAVGMLAMASPASANDDDHDECGFFSINTILGSPENDVLNGTRDCDRIIGFAGNDVLRGRGGEDRLRGGRDNDRLNGVEVFGFPERDVLNGGSGTDVCVIDFLDVALRCEVVIEVDPF